MALSEEFARSGQWLFRRRSWLPLLGLPLLLSQMRSVAVEGAPEAIPLRWPLFCFCVSLAGLALRAYIVGRAAPGTSGRNRVNQVAESLNTTGAYSVVRHPLYLANALMWLGPVLYPQEAWLAVVLALAFWLYYERIMFAEEVYLRDKYGPAFLAWAACTPAFVPDFRRWVPPERPFNWLAVLRREYSGLLLLAFVFVGLERDRVADLVPSLARRSILGLDADRRSGCGGRPPEPATPNPSARGSDVDRGWLGGKRKGRSDKVGPAQTW